MYSEVRGCEGPGISWAADFCVPETTLISAKQYVSYIHQRLMITLINQLLHNDARLFRTDHGCCPLYLDLLDSRSVECEKALKSTLSLYSGWSVSPVKAPVKSNVSIQKSFNLSTGVQRLKASLQLLVSLIVEPFHLQPTLSKLQPLATHFPNVTT